MADNKDQQSAIERILPLLDNVKPSGEGYSALCPSHGDRNNSLSVRETEDGVVLFKCHADCDTEEILTALDLEWADLFPSSNGKGADGLTVEAYAEAKGLTLDFLREQGVSQIHLGGTPVVRVPYMDPSGFVISTRMRLSLKGKTKFRWKAGSKPVLYGLWRLREFKPKYIFLCEGESDTQTLWFNGIQALGLPGASTWNEAWAEYLTPFERIYVVIEPDQGGEAVLKWLAKSKIRDRARLVTLLGAKDPSGLYLADKANFKKNLKIAAKAAIPWSERENAQTRARREAAWTKCKALAQQPDILEKFAEDLGRRGVAGEKRIAKTVFLAMMSRFLSRPTSLVVTGPSSAGKSFTVQQTLDFFPASSYYALTGLSERALAYSSEPLSHRFLVLYEGAALNG